MAALIKAAQNFTRAGQSSQPVVRFGEEKRELRKILKNWVSQRQFAIEALESRLMLSGDGLAAALPPSENALSATEEIQIPSLDDVDTSLTYDSSSQAQDLFAGAHDATDVQLIEEGQEATESAPLGEVDEASLELEENILPVADSILGETESQATNPTISQMVESLLVANGPPGSEILRVETVYDGVLTLNSNSLLWEGGEISIGDVSSIELIAYSASVQVEGALSLSGSLAIESSSLIVNAPIQASGDVSLTTDTIQLNGTVSASGTVTLQPLATSQSIVVAGGASGLFALSSGELDNVEAAGGIFIGRVDGSHRVSIADYTFDDSVTFRSPVIGGGFSLQGTVRALEGAQVTFIGAHSTTHLAADQITTGDDIEILDSVIIDQGITSMLSTGSTLPGDIYISGTLNGTSGGAGEHLILDAGLGDITIDGNVGGTGAIASILIVSARNVTFKGTVSNVGVITQLSGTGSTIFERAVTNVGELNIKTDGYIEFKETLTTSLTVDSVAQSGNVTVSALSSGTSGNMDFRQAVNAAGGFTIQQAKNVEFAGSLTVGGSLTQVSGTGSTGFVGAVLAASAITLNANTIIRVDTSLRASGSGDIRLTSDQIQFPISSNTIIGSGQLVIQPATPTRGIDLGDPLAGTPITALDLSDVEIVAIKDGFSAIVIGSTAGNSGAVLVGADTVFLDPLTLVGTSITIEGNLTGSVSMALTARTGAITQSAGVTTVASMTAQSVTGITLNTNVTTVTASVSGAGDITLAESDSITLTSLQTANGSISVTAQSSIAVVSVQAVGSGKQVTLNSALSTITDSNASLDLLGNEIANIIADAAVLRAALGIGTTATALTDLDIQVKSIDALNSGLTGDIVLRQSAAGGDIDVIQLAQPTAASSGAVSLIADDGEIDLLAAGSITVAGSGTVHLEAKRTQLTGVTSGGVDGVTAVNAQATVTFSGANNDLTIIADAAGAAFNGISIQFVVGGSAGTVTPTYDSAKKVLVIAIGTGVTANDVITALAPVNPAIPFSASIAEGTGNGTITLPTTQTAGGVDAVASTGTVSLSSIPAFTVTATETGTEFNNVTVAFTAGTFGVIYDAPTPANRFLRIRVVENVTTINDIIAAIDAEGTFDATLITGGTSTVTVATLSATGINGGVDGVQASASATLSGSNNDLNFVAVNSGVALNGVTVQFVNGATAGSETAAYDPVNKVLSIKIEDGVTTANQALAAVNAEGTFTASRNRVSELGNTGLGFIDTTNALTTDGISAVTAVAATVRVRSTGTNNDLLFTARATGTAFNNVAVEFVNGATAGNETVVYDTGGAIKTLRVTIQNNVSTAQQVVNAFAVTILGNPAFEFNAALDTSVEGSNTGLGAVQMFPERNLVVQGQINVSSGNINLVSVSQTMLKSTSSIQTSNGGELTVTNGTLLTVESGLTVLLTGKFLQDGVGLVNLGGNISTVNKDITFQSAVTVTSNVQVSSGAGAGNIRFQNTVNAAAATVQNLTLNGGTDGDITFSEVVGGTNSLGTLTITNANNVTAVKAVTAKNIVQSAGQALTKFSGAVSTSGAAGIDLNGTNFTFEAAVTTTGGGTMLVTNGGVLTILDAASLSLDGLFLQDGGGTVAISGNITTTGDTITFTNAVTVADASVTLATTGSGNTAGATIRFMDFLDATAANLQSITLDSGTSGDIQFDRFVGENVALGVLTITQANNVSFEQDLTAKSISQVAGQGLTWFKGTVETNDALGIDLNGTNFTFDAVVTTTGGGPLVITNSGTLTINVAADLSLDGLFRQDGTGAVSLAGDITTTGDTIILDRAVTLISGGTIALNTTSGSAAGAAITFQSMLNATTDNVEALTLNAGTGGNISFNGIVGGIKKLGVLTVTNANNVTAALALTAKSISQVAGQGLTWFTGAVTTSDVAGIDLNGTNFTFDAVVTTTGGGPLVITNSGTLTINAAADLSLDGLFHQDGTGTVSLAGDIATTGDTIIFDRAVTLIGGGTIALNTTSGSATGAAITFKSTLNATTDNVEALTLNVGTGGNIDFNGVVGGIKKLGVLTVINANNVTAALALTAKSISQIAGQGLTWFKGTGTTNDVAGIDLNGTNFTFDAVVTTTGDGPLIVTNSGTLTINAAADLSLDGLFHQDGTGTVSLAGDIATTGDTIIFDRAVTLIGGGTIALNTTSGSATGAAITFETTLNATTDNVEALTLNAGTGGSVDFNGVVGGIKKLGVLTVTNANNVTAALALTAKSSSQVAGQGLTWFKGAVTTSDVAGIDLNGTNFTFDAVVTTTGGGPLVITNSGTLTINAAADLSLDGLFHQDGTGAVSLAGDITTTGDTIIFDRAVTLISGGMISLNTTSGSATGAAITFQSTLDATTDNVEALTLNAGTGGNIDFNGVMGGIKKLGVLTVTNANNVTAALALTAKSISQVAGQGLTWFKGAVTTSDVAGIDLNGTNFTFDAAVTTAGGGPLVITNSGILTINASADLSLDGLFRQDGTGAVSLAGDITTTGDTIIFDRAVTLISGGTISLNTTSGSATGAAITFKSTLNATTDNVKALTLNAGTGGNIDFNGVVGGIKKLGVLTVTNANNVTAKFAVTAKSISQIAGQDLTKFSGAVTTGDIAGIDLNAASVTFEGPVTTTASGPVTVTLGGGVLTIEAAADMSLDGAFLQDGTGLVLLSGDIVTTGDTITITSPVLLFNAATTLLSTTNGGNAAGATITFMNVINASSAGGESLTLNAGTSGNINFDDAVGQLLALKTITITNANDVTADKPVFAVNISQVAGQGLTWFKETLTTTGAAGIDLNGANFSFDGAITTTGTGPMLVTNSGVLTILDTAIISLDGQFLQDGGGSTSLATDITTTGDSIFFTDPITLTDASAILNTTNGGNPSGASITFQNTLNGTTDNAQALTLNAGTGGNIAFNGVVGGATILGVLTVTNANNVTAALALTATSITQGAGQALTWFKGAVTTNDAAGIDLTGTNFTLDANVTTTGGGPLNFHNGGTVTIAATSAVNLAGNFFREGGSISVLGSILAAGTVSIDARNVGSTVTLNGSITTTTTSITVKSEDDVNMGDSGLIQSTSGNVAVIADSDLTADAGAGGRLFMADGARVNAGSGTIALSADENVTLGNVVTTNGTTTAVQITSVSQGIVDGGDTHVDIIANSGRVTLNAATGIGVGNALETQIGTLATTTASGGIEITETDSLSIFSLQVTASGAITISAGQAITVLGNISASGNITLTAVETSDSPTFAQDLTVNSGVTIESTNGAVVLRAGDDILLSTSSIVTAFGSVTIEAAFNDLDSGGSSTLSGTINSGNGVVVDANGDLIVYVINSPGQHVDLETLTGRILDGNGTGVLNITAATLSLSAVAGIGNTGALDVDVDTLTNASVSGTGGIAITDTDAIVLTNVQTANGAITIQAGGLLTATNVVSLTDNNSNDITLITTSGNIIAGVINAGTAAGDVTLNSAGSIVDATGKITADVLTATSVGTAMLDTTVNSVDASVTGVGNLTITETNAIVLVDVDTANGSIAVGSDGQITATDVASLTDNDANDIGISTTSGNIIAGNISAGTNSGDVTLNSVSGAIVDGAGKITADRLTATAAGSATLDTTANSIDASSTLSGGITITETDAITLADVDTANGFITATAGGTVTATDVVSSTDNNANDITITTTAGNIVAGIINAGTAAGDVTLNSAGTIVDATGKITGDVLTATSVGSATLDSTVNSVDASVTGAGNLTIFETNAITLTDLDTATGSITVTAAGTITATDVTSLTDSDVNDISITATIGDIVAGIINAGGVAGDVTLISAGTITDAAGKITGDVLVSTSASSALLDTTVNTVDVSVTGAGNLTITETNAITLTDVDTANGSITVNAGGTVTATDVASLTDNDANDISITATAGGNIVAGIISAGIAGDVTLNSAGTIVDATGKITADVLTATSVGSAALDTTVNSMDASVTGAGNLIVTETNAITLTDVDTANGSIAVTAGGTITATDVQSLTDSDANDIILTVTTGDLLVNLVSAGPSAGDVTLTTPGAINESGNDAGADIIGQVLDLNAVTGVGVTATLETSGQSLSLDTTNGNVDVDNMRTGVVTLSSITTGLGNLFFSQSGGASLIVTTASTSNGSIEMDVAGGSLTVGTVTANGTSRNVTLTTTGSGDVLVGTVTASGDMVTITSAGAVLDNSGSETANVTADTLVIRSGDAIGTGGQDLDVNLRVLDVANGGTNGGIFVTELAAGGSLIVSNLGLTNAANIGAAVVVVESGSLNVNGAGVALAGTGNLLLAAATAGADILINSAVTLGGGNASVLAGRNVSQTAAGDISTTGTGTIDVEALGGDVVMAAGAITQTNGGNIRYRALNHVVVGLLDARTAGDRSGDTLVNQNAWGQVSVTAQTGWILDGGGDAALNLYGSSVRLTGAAGVGEPASGGGARPIIYRLQYSTDLVTWIDLVAGVDEAATIILDPAGSRKLKFYRVISDGVVTLQAPVSLADGTVQVGILPGAGVTGRDTLEVEVITAGAEAGAGGVNLSDPNSFEFGVIGTVPAQRVQVDGTTVVIQDGAPITSLATTGSVVLISPDSVKVTLPLILTGGGNILIETLNAGGNIEILAPVTTPGGSISLHATGAITQSAALTASGTVDVRADGGSITMTDGAVTQTDGGNIRYEASGGVSVGLLDARTPADRAGVSVAGQAGWGTVSVVAGGSITDAGATSPVNVYANAVRFTAGGSVGTLGGGVDPIETEVLTVSALASVGDINILESTGVTVNTVAAVSVNRVQVDGSTTVFTEAGAQSDLTASGTLVLMTVNGSLAVEDGVELNQQGVRSTGSGHVLLQAQGAGSDVMLNTAVITGGGNISVRAADRVEQTFRGHLITSGGTGTIDVESGGSIVMSELAHSQTDAANIRYRAGGEIFLGVLDTRTASNRLTNTLTNQSSWGQVSINALGGRILDATISTDETQPNIYATRARFTATSHVGEPGTGADPIETEIEIGSVSTPGSMWIDDKTIALVGTVGTVPVSRVKADGTLETVQDAAPQSGAPIGFN